MAALCKVCGSVSRNLSKSDKDLPEDMRGENMAIGWSFKIRQLVEAARGGCQFCGFVASRCFESNNLFGYGKLSMMTSIPGHSGSREELSTAFARTLKKFDGVEDDTFTLALRLYHSKGCKKPDLDKIDISIWEVAMGKEELDKRMPYRRVITAEVYALKRDLASKYISSRPINTDFISDESFEQAQTWINNCYHNHPECPQRATPYLPLRVVEVLGEGKLKLNISGVKAPYAALSYCWGGTQETATTLATIDDHVKGFDLSQLPQSLQDAITVASKLGLSYIWIDSLCIVQDSPSDKEKEISRMAQVYSNAYVTICAANANTCKDGFLKPPNSSDSDLVLDPYDKFVKLSYVCPDGTVGSVLLCEESPYHSMWEPISRRAWTLQERLLSPRVLIYGSRLMWQCHTGQHSHGGVENWSFDTLGSGHRRFSSGAFSSKKEIGRTAVDLFTLRQLFDVWYNTVSDYTRRELTFSTDKLPAIGGMAGALQELTGDTYVAGLWRGNLPYDLMWASRPAIGFKKAPTWRAPSWSWASIENSVSYGKITPDSTILAQILKCEVTPRFERTLFGEIQDAVLKIDGPFLQVSRDQIKAIMVAESMGAPPKDNDATLWNRDILNSIMASDSKVESKDWEPPESVYCLLTFCRNWTWDSDYERKKLPHTCFSGLVLEQLDNGQFKRIAAFFNRRADWLGHWDRQTVEIV